MNRNPEIRELEKRAKIILDEPLFQPTKWCVITGAPSSGKTTIITELKKMGFKINSDVSRQLIERQISLGKSIREVWFHDLEFQRLIFLNMLTSTALLPKNEVIFHDYSLPCNIAYLRLAGIRVPRDMYKSAKLFRYDKVFLFEPKEMKVDGIRTGYSDDDRITLTNLLNKVYTGLNYEVVFIHKHTIEKRLNLILEEIQR